MLEPAQTGLVSEYTVLTELNLRRSKINEWRSNLKALQMDRIGETLLGIIRAATTASHLLCTQGT